MAKTDAIALSEMDFSAIADSLAIYRVQEKVNLKLYENVVIGNFLYGLGFAVRARIQTKSVPSIINLLQQTPADKALGDVLLEFPGVVRLIEFKNKKSRSKKERDKHKRINERIKSQVEEYDDYTKISRSIHWFIETHPQESSFVSRIVPYLDAYPRDNRLLDLEKFIESTAEDVLNIQNKFSRQDLCDYLSFVASLHGTGNIGTGGLLLSINPSGNLNFLELTDMMQLKLQHEELILIQKKEYEHELKLMQDQEDLLMQHKTNSLMNKEQDIQPRHEPEITKGISLSP